MSRTVLVADDSPTIQRVVQLAFADEADIDVVVVSSGSEAIEQIEARHPDLVLVDTGMVDRTAYEVAESIKRDSAHSQTPVVLLTGAFEPVDETRAREAGCRAVLVKPFEPAKLVSTVRELLGPVAHVPRSDPSENPAENADLTWPVEGDATASIARFPVEPSTVPVLNITDELVDRVTTEVIARISDRIIQETTREVVGLAAERLVGEEIARLKDRLR